MKLKSYHAKTDQGPYLNLNEDAVEVDLANGLFMIFDGFGGGGVGDQAVSLVKDSIKNFYTKVGQDPEATMPLFYSHQYLIEGNALINAMKIAHSQLTNKNTSLGMDKRGGVSAVCVSLSDSLATLASVGNCMAVLFRRGKTRLVANPQNFELLSMDHYEKEFLTAPISAFGLFEDLHIQLSELRLAKGDMLVLLTDGIYGRLETSEIMDVLNDKSMVVQDRVEEVFSLANNRGNLDNQSILILNF